MTKETSVNWMAPEVLKQKGHTRYSDIWSLGCTLYEIITHKAPWHKAKTRQEVLKRIQDSQGPPKYPPGLSVELTDFLNCCFEV